MKFSLPARLLAEFLGTAFLVAAVVGSGIMGERLAGGNVAIALLANTIATGAALVALILTFGPISGAHLNPAVTLADAIELGIAWPDAVLYIGVQCAGGITGAILAHLMFGLRWYSFSTHSRHGWSLVLSEFVATFGLLSVIWGCSTRAVECGTICRRELHYCCLLVHRVNLICKSSRNNRSFLVEHLRRDSAFRRSSVHRCTTGGSLGRDPPVSVARA